MKYSRSIFQVLFKIKPSKFVLGDIIAMRGSHKSEPAMAEPKRYFVNSLPDYSPSCDVSVKKDPLKAHISQYTSLIETKTESKPNQAEGGLYVGIAGIAYMFFHLSRNPMYSNKRDELISKALEYISASEKHVAKNNNRDPADITGFLLGSSGINAVAAAIYNSTGERNATARNIDRYVAAADLCKPVNFLPYGGDELLVGRAGYICGALWLEQVLQKKVVPIEHVLEVCMSVYESGLRYAKRHNSKCPLMYSYYDTEYLGAAHGLSSILQMLISVPEFLKAQPEVLKNIKDSIDFVLSLQTPNGNFPCAMDEVGQRSRSDRDELVHWCHGGPGVIYLMAKAYLLWREEKYLTSCLKVGNLTWEKGLLKKGPGICHGVAGSGYVFLLLYRLTGNKVHLYRAQQFAEFLNSKQFQKARTPDSPYSLYEGWAGTVCFLSDLSMPQHAIFPFFDVFATSKIN